MSIYQKLNDITSRVVTLEQGASSAVITATTAINFEVTNQLSGGTVLANSLTASNFSASAGLASLTTLTASNFSASTILANTVTASNFSASAGLANLSTLTASNIKVSNDLNVVDDINCHDIYVTSNIHGSDISGSAYVRGFLVTGPNAEFDSATISDLTVTNTLSIPMVEAVIGNFTSSNVDDVIISTTARLTSNNPAPSVTNGALINITGSLYFGVSGFWKKVTLT